MTTYVAWFIINSETGKEYWNSIEGGKCEEAHDRNDDARYSQEDTIRYLDKTTRAGQEHYGGIWYRVEHEE